MSSGAALLLAVYFCISVFILCTWPPIEGVDLPLAQVVAVVIFWPIILPIIGLIGVVQIVRSVIK